MDHLGCEGVVCVKVELTKIQCQVVAEFIEMNILDVIRNDTDIDNIAWLENMLDAKQVLEKAVDEYENGFRPCFDS